jgi:GcrA cell cycle regulator
MFKMKWPARHDEALKVRLAEGMSFSEAAAALNAEFGTRYSRNAAIGRAHRLGIRCDRLASAPRGAVASDLIMRIMRPADRPRENPVSLHCDEIASKKISLHDLEPSMCRWPGGGWPGPEPITFCGHPEIEGLSYCPGHYRTSVGRGTWSERAATFVPNTELAGG